MWLLDDDDDGLYFKTMSIKAAKACGVVYNSWSLSKLTRSMYRKNVELKFLFRVFIFRVFWSLWLAISYYNVPRLRFSDTYIKAALHYMYVSPSLQKEDKTFNPKEIQITEA